MLRKNRGGIVVMDVVDMCARERMLTQDFQLNIDKWDTIDKEVKEIVSNEWKSIKFMNDDGTEINPDVNTLPDDKGGIYLFLLKPNIIPDIHLYIMYIGRVRRKREFSLRKRCKEYLRDTRPSVAYMREVWGKSLYFYYMTLDNDDEIEAVERELIRVIIPPCNSQIPDRYVRYMPDSKAFGEGGHYES